MEQYQDYISNRFKKSVKRKGLNMMENKFEMECQELAEKVTNEIIPTTNDVFWNNNTKQVLEKLLFEQFMACQDSLILSVPIVLKSTYELMELRTLVADVQDYLKVDTNTAETIIADLKIHLQRVFRRVGISF